MVKLYVIQGNNLFRFDSNIAMHTPRPTYTLYSFDMHVHSYSLIGLTKMGSSFSLDLCHCYIGIFNIIHMFSKGHLFFREAKNFNPTLMRRLDKQINHFLFYFLIRAKMNS